MKFINFNIYTYFYLIFVLLDDEIDIEDSVDVDILLLSEDISGGGGDDVKVLGDRGLSYSDYDSTLPPD